MWNTNPLYEGPKHSYDRQVIVQLQFDDVTNRSSRALNDYAARCGMPSEIVPVRPSSGRLKTFSRKDAARLAEALKKLTTRSRVYLDAHGDWEMQALGDYKAKAVAGLLADAGMPQVKLVSVLGCEMGRDSGTANDTRVALSMDSFGSQLHRELKKRGIKTTVYARVYCVAVGNEEKGAGRNDPALRGKKGTFNSDDDWESWDDGVGHHRAKSKFRYYWAGDQQRRDWAY